MNKNLVMDCIKLCVITLIAGLLLGIVYNVTKAYSKMQRNLIQ